jgi:hypothetical protein
MQYLVNCFFFLNNYLFLKSNYKEQNNRKSSLSFKNQFTNKIFCFFKSPTVLISLRMRKKKNQPLLTKTLFLMFFEEKEILFFLFRFKRNK